MNDDKRNRLDLSRGTGLFASAFAISWLFVFALAVGGAGVMIWAVIKLVNHFTG